MNRGQALPKSEKRPLVGSSPHTSDHPCTAFGSSGGRGDEGCGSAPSSSSSANGISRRSLLDTSNSEGGSPAAYPSCSSSLRRGNSPCSIGSAGGDVRPSPIRPNNNGNNNNALCLSPQPRELLMKGVAPSALSAPAPAPAPAPYGGRPPAPAYPPSYPQRYPHNNNNNKLSNSNNTNPQRAVPSVVVPKKGFTFFDTRTNRLLEGAPMKWKGAGTKSASAPQPKAPEARAMTQSYQQFISLKILLSESRRYAWENIVMRHPEASADEVLVYQFNSTWCQLVDDVTAAIVERQVPTVAAASSVINMMELFQRHSPAVDLLPDGTPPVGPRHLPIDWYEAQRQDVRMAVVEERQARKARAIMRASPPTTTPMRRGR